ncbi:MAG: RnfABCDGE type electron transport complex subunit D [Bullifex sp.]
MKTVSVSPHIHSGNSIRKSMLLVTAALLPSAAWGVWSFGLSALVVLLVSIAASLLTEFLLGLVSKEKTLSDGSALVTGLLIGMNMPPTVPLYVPVLASVFAILVVKWTFGGLGCNWMNPALAGRVFVFFSFTTLMSTFVLPGSLQNDYILPGRPAEAVVQSVDEVSAATLTTAESNGQGGMIIVANKYVQVDFPSGYGQDDISAWADAVIAKYPEVFPGVTYFFNASGVLEFEFPSKINDLYHTGIISIVRTEIGNYLAQAPAADAVSAATKKSGVSYRAGGFEGSTSIANRYITVDYPTDVFSASDMASWADGVIASYPELFAGATHFEGKGYYEFALPEKIDDNLHDMYNSVVKAEIVSLIGGGADEEEADAVSSATVSTSADSGFGGTIEITNQYITIDYPEGFGAAEFSAWADEMIASYPELFEGATHFEGRGYYEFELADALPEKMHDPMILFLRSRLNTLVTGEVDATSGATKTTDLAFEQSGYSASSSITGAYITVEYPASIISDKMIGDFVTSLSEDYMVFFEGCDWRGGAGSIEIELYDALGDDYHDMVNSIIETELSKLIKKNAVDAVSAATKQTYQPSGFGGTIAIANKYVTVDYQTDKLSESEMSAWADGIISSYPGLFDGVTYFFNDSNIEFVFPEKIKDQYHDGLVSLFKAELSSVMKPDVVLADAVSSATKITGVEYTAGDFSGATSIANKYVTVDYPLDRISVDQMAAWADGVIAKYSDLFAGATHFAGATYYEFEFPSKINDNYHDLINAVLASEVSSFITENSGADTVSGATMLSAAKTALVSGASGPIDSRLAGANVPVTPMAASLSGKTGLSPYTIDAFLGNQAGCIGEVSALLLIIGGIFLIASGVITWHIPVIYIGSFALLAWIFGGIPAGMGLFHGEILTPLFTGGLMLGAFFMATDWVTTPTSVKGQVVFAIGCGFLTFLFRYFGSLPEGTSLAIILMNIVTPTIDRYIRPKKFGYVKPVKEKK